MAFARRLVGDAVRGFEARRIQDVAFDRRQDGWSVERALDGCAINIERVDGEGVVVRAFVVPGWEWTVVAKVFAAHVWVAGKPTGVAIESRT